MLEILALSFFVKKIRQIAEAKNIKPTKWMIILLITWFGVEFGTIALFFIITGVDFEDGIWIAIPAVLFAVLSAFIVINQFDKEPEVPSDEIATNAIEI